MNEIVLGGLCVDLLLNLTPQVEAMTTLLNATSDESVRL